MLDLKVKERFDSTGDIMRWLTRRLPGITHLTCNATFAHEINGYQIGKTKAAALWLVAQLPELCIASTSTFKLSLMLDPDPAAKLLRLDTKHLCIQDDFWSALSQSLTELCVIMTPSPNVPMRINVFNQLSYLTSLKIDMGGESDFWTTDEVAASHVMSLPRLKSLHMNYTSAEDVVLDCPGLRSLNVYRCSIKGNLFLPASLEELSIKECQASRMHEASAVRGLLALTSLTSLAYNVPGGVKQDSLYGILPSMSVLRKLDLIILEGQHLPSQLPASLQMIRYSLSSGRTLFSRELQHFAGACQLPALQSMSLHKWGSFEWLPGQVEALEKIQANSKANILVQWKSSYTFFWQSFTGFLGVTTLASTNASAVATVLGRH